MHSDILKSLQTLHEGAGALARGELDTRIDNMRSDELGAVVRSFNRMAEKLETVHNEREMLDRLQAMLISSETEAEAICRCPAGLPALVYWTEWNFLCHRSVSEPDENSTVVGKRFSVG